MERRGLLPRLTAQTWQGTLPMRMWLKRKLKLKDWLTTRPSSWMKQWTWPPLVKPNWPRNGTRSRRGRCPSKEAPREQDASGWERYSRLYTKVYNWLYPTHTIRLRHKESLKRKEEEEKEAASAPKRQKGGTTSPSSPSSGETAAAQAGTSKEASGEQVAQNCCCDKCHCHYHCLRVYEVLQYMMD